MLVEQFSQCYHRFFPNCLDFGPLNFLLGFYQYKCLDFSSLELFDILCISDHVQPISKPFSVVLAECEHFVVTWSVQEFMWSLGLCRNIPSQPFVIMWSHWSQQNEAQKETKNFYIKFTFNSAIQCSSKML